MLLRREVGRSYGNLNTFISHIRFNACSVHPTISAHPSHAPPKVHCDWNMCQMQANLYPPTFVEFNIIPPNLNQTPNSIIESPVTNYFIIEKPNRMFKKRAQVKTVNLIEDASTITIDEIKKQHNPDDPEQPNPNQRQTIQNKKINTFTMKQTKQPEPVAVKTEYDLKVEMGLVPQPNQKYGLIDKQGEEKVKVPTNLVMDMYVKEKLKEYTKKQQPVVSVKMQTATQIFQMQRRYLQPTEQKIASYDVNQIQRKLQLMSSQLIKSEQQKRTHYLKNLLENQLQKMEYASKKELKMIRQEKERDQKYLNANYSKEGRRHEINKLKKEAFNDFINRNG